MCELQACILNYTKEGTPFWNQFLLQPVRNPDGKTVMYLGLQADVTEAVTRELQGMGRVCEAKFHEAVCCSDHSQITKAGMHSSRCCDRLVIMMLDLSARWFLSLCSV